MFFGNGLGESFMSIFATHPPLEERIRAIDPSWDGKLPRAADLPILEDQPASPAAFAGISALAQSTRVRSPAPPTTVRMQNVMPDLGKPTPMHLRYAEELRESFPDAITAATREPLAATALIYALLLSEDAAMRATQLRELATQTSANFGERAAALRDEVASIAVRARLPLVNLALPALRHLRPEEFEKFSRTLKWLIESDEQVDLFEFVLQKIIQHNLAVHFAPARPAITQFYTMKPLVPDVEILLSALARVRSRVT